MKSQLRQEAILKLLVEAESPLTAGFLSLKFGVSRQIIVKDIAKLRDEGYDILSLSKGYKMNENPKRVFKIIHTDEDVEKELNLIIDFGGKVDDVFIFHKVYDKVTARMDIKSRYDISKFVNSIKNGKSSLLKNVTSGYHYHTVSAESEDTLNIIQEKLGAEGFLASYTDFEPDEIKKQYNL